MRAYRKAVEEDRREHTNRLLRRAVLKYLRRDFHPDQNDNYHLAATYLGSVA
jgi:predicted metal-dependent hydrolase